MKIIRTFVIANIEVMAKDKIAYVCSNCGQESAKWVGKCPSCGQWNTFSEIRISGETGSMAAKQAAANVHKAMSHSGARPMLLRDIVEGRATHRHPRHGAEPCAGRRTGKGQHSLARRRAGHRQEYAHTTDYPEHAGEENTLRER